MATEEAATSAGVQQQEAAIQAAEQPKSEPPLGIFSGLHWSIRWAIPLIAGVVLWFVRLPQLAEKPEHGFALAIALFLAWILGAASPGLLATLFVAVAILTGIATGPELLTQAWTGSTMWFILASFAFGLAVSDSRLGERVAAVLLPRFTGSLWMFGIFIIVIGGLLSLIGMAGSFSRIGIIFPMIAVVATLSTKQGKIRAVTPMALMMFAIGFQTLQFFYNGFWLNASFLTLARVQVNYVQWSVDFLVPSLIVALFGLVAVNILFPAKLNVPREVIQQQQQELGPISGREWRVIGFLALALALWFTSIWTSLDAGWIALGVAALMMLPRVGVLSYERFLKGVNWDVVLFLSGAFALGGLMKSLGIAKWLGGLIIPENLPHNPILLALIVCVSTMLIHLFAGDTGSSMAVTVPLFSEVARSFGYNPVVFGFIAYATLSAQFFFIYQEAAVVFGYGWGMYTQKDTIKLGLLSFIYVPLALAVISIGYWQLIGVL